MKTFKEYCRGTSNFRLDHEASLSGYLTYALGEMEKQLHPRMVVNAAFSEADEAYNRGYSAAQKAKAHNRGYRDAAKAEVYDYTSHVDIGKLQRENKAARECAMIWLDGDNIENINAIYTLREALGIIFEDVKAYNNK